MFFAYLQSVVVYSFLALIMILLSKKYVIKGEFKYIIFAIGIYAFVFGIRYGVGTDFFGYVNSYEELAKKGYIYNEEIEGGFVWLMRILAPLHSSALFLGVVAFLQMLPVVFALKNDKYVFPALFFVFMFDGVWLGHANLLRQVISIGLWTLAIKYAVEKKILIHYLLVFAAILFHRSAIILLPFYPIFLFKTDWFKNIKIDLLLLVGSLVAMNIISIQDFFTRIDQAIGLLGYERYTDYNATLLNDEEATLGIGFFITLITNIFIIVNSNKIKEYFKNDFLNGIYSLFFIGTLFKYVFTGSQMLQRVNMYFYSFYFIVMAYALYYFLKTKKNLQLIFLVGLILLTFVAILYKGESNSSLFVFNWQDDLFYLHKEQWK